MSCMIVSGPGLCLLSIVLAEADRAIRREAFDPSDVHRGGPWRTVADVPHAMAVDQQSNLLDDDAAAVELNGRGVPVETG